MKIAALVLLSLVLFYIHMNPNGLGDDDVDWCFMFYIT